MTRKTLTGILALAAGLSSHGLMAQAPKGPAPKSQGEAKAVQALAGAQGNPDATIKAADELLTKYTDTEFKEIALTMEASAYAQKGDSVKAQIYGEQVLAINPKNSQITLMMGTLIAQGTHENDLDRDERLAKSTKYLNDTMENLKTTPKPNPQLTDQQWEEAKKYLNAQAYNGLGLIQMTLKKYDGAIAEFKIASDLDPQPAYQVRLASADQLAGKNDEALAICDKLLADPQLHPTIKAVATQIKAAASKK